MSPDSSSPPAASPSRWWIPSLLDFLFLSLIVWLFLAGPNGWTALLSDGDTGWHIRVGDWVRAHGQVPHEDLFSFSKAGEPWYAWEWLAELLFSFAHSAAGLKGVVLLCGMMIPAYLILLSRHMLWRGATPLLALAVLLLTSGCSAIHYLARPHLFTLLFLSISLWALDADLERPSARIYWLVPLTVLWVNLHGGFVALPVCLAAYAAGGLVRREYRSALRYAGLAAACVAASVLNPYGLELHRHIVAYLRSDWIKDVVDEFQSPRFRSEPMYYYEALLLAGAGACVGLARKGRWSDVFLILGWAHLSLSAVRHVPVFLLVAGPRIAAMYTEYWESYVASTGRRSIARTFDELSADLRPKFGRASLWMAAPVVALLLLGSPPVSWPRQFPAQRFPVALIEAQRAAIEGRRLLATDEWGDYLLYRFPGTQRVFFDGRSDFYGPEVGKDYVALMNAAPAWRALLDKYRFEGALLPPDWPLAVYLRQEPGWRLAASEKDALLFLREAPPAVTRRPAGSKEIAAASLMKRSGTAETTGGGHRMIPRSEPDRRSRKALSPLAAPVPGSWILPGGQTLAEFALRSGIVAPSLLALSVHVTAPVAGGEAERPDGSPRRPGRERRP